eukprot:404126-Lingulodinium_polyedra.AAC.1
MPSVASSRARAKGVGAEPATWRVWEASAMSRTALTGKVRHEMGVSSMWCFPPPRTQPRTQICPQHRRQPAR